MWKELCVSDHDLHEGAKMKQDKFLPDNYTPAEDEPFMNDRQVEYFRRKLIAWKNDLLIESRETIEDLQDGTRNIPDMACVKHRMNSDFQLFEKFTNVHGRSSGSSGRPDGPPLPFRTPPSHVLPCTSLHS